MTASSTDTPQAAPSLAPLVALLARDMEQVNARIIARMASDVPLVPELAGHLIAAGGKRLRPLLTLAGAGLAGGSPHAIGLATAVEFIHSATLLHDDVIDESKLRRGRDTANALWGNDASVLVGDFLFARAFELMVETGSLSVLAQLSHASARITEGEIKQMTIAGVPDTPAEDYLDVIRNKTAILFAAATATGGRSEACIALKRTIYEAVKGSDRHKFKWLFSKSMILNCIPYSNLWKKNHNLIFHTD